jgi:hypothetical protein
MSLEVDGVWKTGVWATTVWADDVWFEGSGVGSTITFFTGVSSFGLSDHQGVSRPTLALTAVGGGLHTVVKTHGLSGNQIADSVSTQKHLVDGNLP